MKTLIYGIILSLILSVSCYAQVDTVGVYSPSMKKEIKNVVVLPADYQSTQTNCPVIYLLHGYSDNYKGWISFKPELAEIATARQIIFVCPNGENSWYWDSPVNPALQYETYVAKELVQYIDQHYRTVNGPEGRAITGLSMGGHGGLWLGINHPDVFGACGSMSGGVDIRPFPNNWEMAKSLGSYKDNPEMWDNHTVITQIHKIPRTLRIIIDCGTEDFFYPVNRELHKELLYHNVKHDFISRPGAHNRDYWKNAADYQILFFSKFFQEKK